MKTTYFALLSTLLLAGCSEAYSRLEASFAVQSLSDAATISGTSMTITGPSNRGATNYQKLVDVHVSSNAVGISVKAPFHKALLIPGDNISACAMTCFGMNDRHLDLLIASTGSVLSFPSDKRLLDWCWESKKQVYPGDVERSWEYSGGKLPPRNMEDPQFSSREAYDNAMLQSCRGF